MTRWSIRDVVARRPVTAFFVLAYGIAWALMPLVSVSQLFGLLGLFAPAAAGILVAAATHGRAGAGELVRRVGIWRVGPVAYLLALGIPVAIAGAVAVIGTAPAGVGAVRLSPIVPLGWVVFVLVVGEEIGWRGYAQPTLAARGRPVMGALLVGFLWGMWHLPTFYLEGLPQKDIPLAAFVIFTMAYSVVAQWLLPRARGSLLIATLFHGSFNLFTFVTPGLGIVPRWWLTAAVWSGVAVVAGWAVARRPAPAVSTRLS